MQDVLYIPAYFNEDFLMERKAYPMQNNITVVAISTPDFRFENEGADSYSKTMIFKQSFDAGTTDTANFIAIVHALKVLKRDQQPRVALYSDSPEAIYWVTGKKCEYSLRRCEKRGKLVEALRNAEKWLARNDYETEIIQWDVEKWSDINAFAFSQTENTKAE